MESSHEAYVGSVDASHTAAKVVGSGAPRQRISSHCSSGWLSDETLPLPGRSNKLCFILEPSGLIRQVWDSLAVLLILLVVLLLPIWVAYFSSNNSCGYLLYQSSDGFETALPPSSEPLTEEQVGELAGLGHDLDHEWRVLWFVMDVFFLVDMAVVNPITAFYRSDGSVEYRWRHIIVNYLLGWFWVDLVANIPLECAIAAITADHVDTYNFGRAIRLVRLLGVSRRTHSTAKKLLERVSQPHKDFTYALRGLLKWFFFTFLAMHYSSCSLWLVLRMQDFPPGSWPVELDVVGSSVGSQYTWSLFNVMSAMIGLSHGAFPPRTLAEAVLWLFVMGVMATMFSVFNALVIAYMVSSRARATAFQSQMDQVLRLLHRTNLPSSLQKEVVTYLRRQYKAGFGSGVEKELQVLSSALPSGLVSRIMSQTAIPALLRYPLLCRSYGFMEELARSLETIYCSPGYLMVEQGHSASTFYFIDHGLMDILMDETVIGTLKNGQCFGGLAMLHAVRMAAASNLAAYGLEPLVEGVAVPDAEATVQDGAGQSQHQNPGPSGDTLPGSSSLPREGTLSQDRGAGPASSWLRLRCLNGPGSNVGDSTNREQFPASEQQVQERSPARQPPEDVSPRATQAAAAKALHKLPRLHPGGAVAQEEGVCYHVHIDTLAQLLQYHPRTLTDLSAAACDLLKDLERVDASERAMRLMLFPLLDRSVLRRISRRVHHHVHMHISPQSPR